MDYSVAHKITYSCHMREDVDYSSALMSIILSVLVPLSALGQKQSKYLHAHHS